jgi:O-antigen/teichoic acid export membrane protein
MFLGTIFFRGSNLVAGVFVARHLGKEVFGQYGVIQSSILMFTAFGALGLGITSTNFVAQLKTTDRTRAGRVMGFCSVVAIASGTLMALIMYFSAAFLAEKMLAAPELIPFLKISALLLLFTAWQDTQNGSLVGVEAFRAIALVNVLSGVLLVTLTIWGAQSSGLIGAVWGWVCATIAQSLANTFALWRANKCLGIMTRFSFELEEFRLLWRFSLPAALGGLMFGPIVWGGNAILVNAPNGFAEMGRYNAGYQWFAILLFLPGIINNALLPMLSERKGSKDYTEMKNMFIMGLKISFAVLGPLCVGVILMSPLIMKLYGKNFENGCIVLSIFACAAFVAGVQNLIGNMIAVMDKMWLHFKMNIFWAASFLLLGWFFVSINLGATGLALATLCSYTLRLIWSLIVVSKFLKGVSIHEQSKALVSQ